MRKIFAVGFRNILIIPITLLTMGIWSKTASAQNKLYSPIPLTNLTEISDILSNKDIPTGQGGLDNRQDGLYWKINRQREIELKRFYPS